MPVTLPNLRYNSGDFTVATACTLPVFEKPFADQGVNIDYLLHQDFIQNLNDYTPLALDTPHPDFADFILVSEGPQTDLNGGKIRWTRTYAKVPAEFSRPAGNYSYNFIGFYGSFGINVTTVTGRNRFTKNVPVRLTRTFFNTTDPDADIPEVPATRYYYGSSPNVDVDFLADSPPFTEATTPSRTAYEALIATDAGAPASYSLVVESSTVQVWKGNIYVRETRYVKAL